MEKHKFKFEIPREFILKCRGRTTIDSKDLMKNIGWYRYLDEIINQLRHAQSIIFLVILKHSGTKALVILLLCLSLVSIVNAQDDEYTTYTTTPIDFTSNIGFKIPEDEYEQLTDQEIRDIMLIISFHCVNCDNVFGCNLTEFEIKLIKRFGLERFLTDD